MYIGNNTPIAHILDKLFFLSLVSQCENHFPPDVTDQTWTQSTVDLAENLSGAYFYSF